MNKKVAIALLAIPVALTSCYYDNFKELHPENAVPSSGSTCDTISAISYSLQITPILTAACTGNCHNGTSSGHIMTNYTAVKADAVSGALYGSVAQDGSAQNMPQGGSKLSTCDITMIKKWAAAGAPNN